MGPAIRPGVDVVNSAMRGTEDLNPLVFIHVP